MRNVMLNPVQKRLAGIHICLLVLFGTTNILAQTDEERAQAVRTNSRMFQLYQALEAASYDGPYAKSLAIVPSQREVLSEIVQAIDVEYKRNIAKTDAELKDVSANVSLSPEQKTKEIHQIRYRQAKECTAMFDRHFAKAEKILLPGQYKLLRQLALKEGLVSELQLNGFEAYKQIFDLLELSDSQEKELEQTLKEVQDEFAKARTKLREEFENKAKKSLPPQSRKKLDSLFGEWYWFD